MNKLCTRLNKFVRRMNLMLHPGLRFLSVIKILSSTGIYNEAENVDEDRKDQRFLLPNVFVHKK